MKLVLLKESNSFSRLITEQEANALIAEGRLVIVESQLYEVNDPLILHTLAHGWHLKSKCAIPVDGDGVSYYPMDVLHLCNIDNGQKYYLTLPDGLFLYNGSYYNEEGLTKIGVVRLADGNFEHQDRCYFDPDTKTWYLDDDSTKSLFSYHYNGGNRPKYAGSNTTVFIGFEVEKAGFPPPHKRMTKEEILAEYGWTLEKDSSVSKGFELVSPVFNLYSQKIEKSSLPLKAYFDVPNLTNAGGHITLSMKGLTSTQLLDKMSSWIPIILSMYRGRLTSNYCYKATLDHIKEHTGDRKAIHNKGNGKIEFRVVSAVKSYSNFLWRVKLFRFIMSNLDMTFDEIIGSAIEGKFNAILVELKVYQTKEGLRTMLNAAVNIHNKYVISNPGNRLKFSKLIKDKQFKDVYSDSQAEVQEVAQGAS